MPRYLILFSHDTHWLDFKFAELNALLELNGVDPKTAYSSDNISVSSVFLIIELMNDSIVTSLASRSVTIRAIYQLWSLNSTYLSQVIESVKENIDTFLTPYSKSTTSWSLQVESIFGALTPEDKQYYRDLLYHPTFESLGPVKVIQPDIELHLLLNLSDRYERNQHLQIPAYFGRLVSRTGMRDVINKFDLKKRLYLGPTSLDTSLAFILANIAQVQYGDIVLDPFVGTASILVALSHFGCHCFGTDIDPRVLRGNMYAGKHKDDNGDGKGKNGTKRDIFENFKMYGLSRPELIRLDNHLCDRHYVYNSSSSSSTSNSNNNSSSSSSSSNDNMTSSITILANNEDHVSGDSNGNSNNTNSNNTNSNSAAVTHTNVTKKSKKNKKSNTPAATSATAVTKATTTTTTTNTTTSSTTISSTTNLNATTSIATTTSPTAATTTPTAPTQSSHQPPSLQQQHHHHHHQQYKDEGMFECIVTDPPYGIRAGAKKCGKKGGVAYSVAPASRHDHIPTTQTYPVEEVMLDLLHTAGRLLVVGGKLIYLIPTTYDFELSDLPVHPCFRLNLTCEQPLSSRHGRRAVFMTKIKSYTNEYVAEFLLYKQQIMMVSSAIITSGGSNWNGTGYNTINNNNDDDDNNNNISSEGNTNINSNNNNNNNSCNNSSSDNSNGNYNTTTNGTSSADIPNLSDGTTSLTTTTTTTNTTTTLDATDTTAATNNLGFAKLMMKLSRALTVDAFYDDGVVKRASNSCVKRKESIAKKKKHRLDQAAKNNSNNNNDNSNLNNHDDDDDDDVDDDVTTTNAIVDNIINETAGKALIKYGLNESHINDHIISAAVLNTTPDDDIDDISSSSSSSLIKTKPPTMTTSAIAAVHDDDDEGVEVPKEKQRSRDNTQKEGHDSNTSESSSSSSSSPPTSGWGSLAEGGLVVAVGAAVIVVCAVTLTAYFISNRLRNHRRSR